MATVAAVTMHSSFDKNCQTCQSDIVLSEWQPVEQISKANENRPQVTGLILLSSRDGLAQIQRYDFARTVTIWMVSLRAELK